jgi:plastocyanin
MSHQPVGETLRSIVGTSLTERVRDPIAVVVLLGVIGPCSVLATENHIVTIRGMRFNPPQMRVAVGDSIEWKNEDIFAHTVTANDGSFDSGLIPPTSSWQTMIRRARVR